MRAHRWSLWCWVAASGCAIEGPATDESATEAPAEHEPPRPRQGESLDRFIHVGGICSTRFTDGKKATVRLGEWEGTHSVDAVVDQRSSMATAVADLRQTLDDQCTGEGWCYLYGYSNGAAVISKTLATYEPERWNVLWVLNTASNEGGSELSGGLASIGATLGVSCELAAHISPSDHRAGWNHNDTAGNTIYHVGGHHEWWYTGGFPDFFGGSANDGAVGYHSAGGLNDVYYLTDDDPWLCYDESAHWDQHQVAYSCQGYDRDHYQMALTGIEEMGG